MPCCGIPFMDAFVTCCTQHQRLAAISVQAIRVVTYLNTENNTISQTESNASCHSISQIEWNAACGHCYLGTSGGIDNTIKYKNIEKHILPWWKHSVKCSDVTGNPFQWLFDENTWEHRCIRPPPPYFILLDSSVKTLEINAIEFHRIESMYSNKEGYLGDHKATLWVWKGVSATSHKV